MKVHRIEFVECNDREFMKLCEVSEVQKQLSITARKFKMGTILEQFNALVSYILVPCSFQILCIISEKIGQGHASLVSLCSCGSRPLPAAQNPIYWFCGCNKLNPTSQSMNSFADTNECALVCSFCQYCNRSMIN